MKNSPNEYVEMLIDQYYKNIPLIGFSGTYSTFMMLAIQCAINDVNNTIEALTELKFNYNYPTITYYTEVLNILKSKL